MPGSKYRWGLNNGSTPWWSNHQPYHKTHPPPFKISLILASSVDSGPSAPTVASQQCGASEDARGWSASNQKQTYQVGFGWWSDHPPYHTKNPPHTTPTQPPPSLVSPAILDKATPPIIRIWCVAATNAGGRPYDDDEGLIGGGFGRWPATPQTLQIAPSTKSVPALPLPAVSNKAATHIARGGCAASTRARGLASDDRMGLNKGPPW